MPRALGYAATADLCAAQYGSGAHLCMMDDLYQAVVNGTLKATDTIPSSWVYMPSWNTPIHTVGIVEPLNGLADHCGGYTTRGNSNHWAGILVEWGPLPDGTAGFRWHGGSAALCSSEHRVTCCK